MKAEDLRVGNYYKAGIEIKGSREAKLNFMDSDRTIKLSIEHFQVMANAPMIAEMIQPIPLTEDWLVRLGFEVSNGCGRIRFVDFAGFECEFGVSIDDVYAWISPTEGSTTVEVRHVHDLQNLYRALTGKELTFTLPAPRPLT